MKLHYHSEGAQPSSGMFVIGFYKRNLMAPFGTVSTPFGKMLAIVVCEAVIPSSDLNPTQTLKKIGEFQGVYLRYCHLNNFVRRIGFAAGIHLMINLPCTREYAEVCTRSLERFETDHTALQRSTPVERNVQK